MRIALVSTPFLPVPPPSYGGTELVVGDLADALTAMGCEVVVYATGDSHLSGIEVRSYLAQSRWPPEAAVDAIHSAWCMRDIARDPLPFDVVHLHTIEAVPLARRCPYPVVYTVHHDHNETLTRRYQANPGLRYLGISHSQASREPARLDAVVHHGLNPDRFHPLEDQGYLLFLGRYDKVKGPDVALEVARRSGLPLLMAGAPHNLEYWEEELRPMLASAPVFELGPVGGARKAALIARARAVLFPIRWDEPFGLVMIEAMLAGVPVLASARGSVPEVIDDGITGLVCDDPAEMAHAARHAARIFDRKRVRERAVERWSSRRMAEDALEQYRVAIRHAADTRLGSSHTADGSEVTFADDEAGSAALP